MAFTPTFGGKVMPWLSQNSDMLLQASAGLLGGSTPQEQMSGLMQGVAGAKKKNRTIEFLRQNNPELAQAVENGDLSGGDAFKIFYQQKMEAEKPQNNFMAAGGSIFNKDTQEWISPPQGAGSDAEYGLNPVWGKDAQGNTVLGQLSKNGTFQQTQMPDGFTPSPGISNIDTGTGTLSVNSRTGVPVMNTPKDVAGAAAQSTGGKLQAEAKVNLPQTEAAAGQILSTIDSLESDPYLPEMLGPWQSKLPNTTADAARVQSKMDQVGGQAFMQAFNALKGAGQITEQEGAKASAAMARLNTAQSPEDYKQALNELRGVVNTAVSNARAKAGIASEAPQTGVVDYSDYFGGN